MSGTTQLADQQTATPDGKPSALGAWNQEHRRAMLSYLRARDDGRCGLCGVRMKVPDESHIRIVHIVPRDILYFDVKNGCVKDGLAFRSVLSDADNLQAVHAYCESRHTHRLHLVKMRHRSLPPVPVAERDDGKPLSLPVDGALVRGSTHQASVAQSTSISLGPD